MAASEIDVSKLLSPAAAAFIEEEKTTRQARTEAIKEAVYWIVSIPGDDDPRCQKAESLDALLSKLRKLVDKDTQVFVFAGQKLSFTTSAVFPRKLILSPTEAVSFLDGSKIIRREDDPDFPVQADGFMGDPRLYELMQPDEKSNDREATEDDFD